MEKDKKFRALAIAALCIAIVGVSVAYAALTTTLTITGTATVDTGSAWNVAWTDARVTSKDSSITVSEGPTMSGTNISWKASFTAPNTTLVLTATIKNSGTLYAMLQAPTDETGPYLTTGGEISGNFEYTVTINGEDATAKANSILAANGGTATVVVTVKLKDMDNAAFEALNEKSATFMLSLPFVQAADGITTPVM